MAKTAQVAKNVPKRKVPDRRVERTRKALSAALHSLVAHRPYEEISLRDILTEANVGRSTFYLHFRDKDDLLLSTVSDVMTVVTEAPAMGNWPDSFLWFSLPMLEYHAHRKRLSGHRMSERGKNILHGHLERAICNLIETQVHRQFRDVDLVQGFIASTFVLVLNWWLRTKETITPGEADALFKKMVVPGLVAFRVT